MEYQSKRGLLHFQPNYIITYNE